MAEIMTLIGGRSKRQGTALCEGKTGAEYLDVTTIVEMNVEDMARLGLKPDSKVRLRTPSGETILRCKSRETKDLPKGLLFMAYGPASSQLMAGDTAGSGMPLSKNLQVEVEPVGADEAPRG
ncbi:MAG: molybdopterin dinucleotide binding domain-containing protein [Gemmatimonadales bacterium]